MQENVRRLIIPTREKSETQEPPGNEPSTCALPVAREPAAAQAAKQTGSVSVDLSGDDFATLKRILSTLSADGGSSDDAADSPRRRVAEIMFNMRKSRSGLFPASMFNEPAWDMLMALYVAHEVSAAADLARSTNTPITTAMRWIEYLEAHKLIVREASSADRRAHLIRLTDLGRSNMDALFSDVIAQWP